MQPKHTRILLALVATVALTACKSTADQSAVKDLVDTQDMVNNGNGTWTVHCKNGTVETASEATITANEVCPQLVASQRYFNGSQFDFATVTDDQIAAFTGNPKAAGYALQGTQFRMFRKARAYGIDLQPVYLCLKQEVYGGGFMPSLAANCESAGGNLFGNAPVGYVIPLSLGGHVQAHVQGLQLKRVDRCSGSFPIGGQQKLRHMTSTGGECGPGLTFPDFQPLGYGVQ